MLLLSCSLHVSTKRTSGLYIVPFASVSVHPFPMTWRTTLHTSTGTSSAEAPTVRSVSRRVSDRRRCLSNSASRRWLVCRVDDTQTMSAAKKGYSGRLRHLACTQRLSIGFLHEVGEDHEMTVDVSCTPTTEQKSGIFTKPMHPARYAKAINIINCGPGCDEGKKWRSEFSANGGRSNKNTAFVDPVKRPNPQCHAYDPQCYGKSCVSEQTSVRGLRYIELWLEWWYR